MRAARGESAVRLKRVGGAMATPDFIVRLREKIGHDPLWLVGVTAYIEDDEGRVLLGRRADSGKWALISGINEPGEDPADTAVREAYEEAAVVVEPLALASVKADKHLVTYVNGDQTRYLDLLFVCRAQSTDEAPHVNDDESLAVGWFSLDGLPEPLTASTVERIGLVRQYRERCASGDARALFSVQPAL